MIDCIIRNCVVVDGTGAPRFRGDIAIDDGVIVDIGSFDHSARKTIDAGGLVVTPGFIDPHTHYDAALMWDPHATPSIEYGVTTMVGGNCGFTIAPCSPENSDYLMRLLASVEGIPLETLQAGLQWGWRTFGDWLDRLEGKIAINAGFFVGHSALRAEVMGDQIHERASEAQLEAIRALLQESIEAGGFGLSSSGTPMHQDHLGDPVPSRAATDDELIALAAEVSRHAGTVLEHTIGHSIKGLSDHDVELMAKMSAASERMLNWGVLTVEAERLGIAHDELEYFDRSQAFGGKVTGLLFPTVGGIHTSFLTGFIVKAIPGWEQLFKISIEERIASLEDPVQREGYLARAVAATEQFGFFVDFAEYRVTETFSPINEGLAGRKIGSIAQERSQSPFDVLIDIALADELRTGFEMARQAEDEISWHHRALFALDDRTVVGGSDAGAHVDSFTGFTYPADLITEMVTRRQLLTLEQAIRLMTDKIATMYGLKNRGRLAVGFAADILILDPPRFTAGPTSTRYDLPGGAGRLYSKPGGLERVLVNGVEVLGPEADANARPGQLMRSGRDTVTVPIGSTGPCD